MWWGVFTERKGAERRGGEVGVKMASLFVKGIDDNCVEGRLERLFMNVTAFIVLTITSSRE